MTKSTAVGHESTKKMIALQTAHTIGDALKQPEMGPSSGGVCGLHLAVVDGNLAAVERNLANGSDPDEACLDGRTPIILAAKQGHAEILTRLIDAKACCNACSVHKATALHHAASRGSVDMTCALLDASASLDARTQAGCTPFYQAVQHGHLDCAQLLLSLGADQEARTHTGATPVYIAADHGHPKLLEMLLDSGADATVQTDLGLTAALIAAFNGHEDVLRTLMHYQKKHQDGQFSWLEQRGVGGCTPLYIAAQQGHTEVARVLLEAGVSADPTSQDCLTPSLVASTQGHVEVLRLLVAAKATVTAAADNGCTLAMLGAQHGHIGVLQCLVDAGGASSFHIARADGETALSLARSAQHTKVTHFIKRVLQEERQAWADRLPGILEELGEQSSEKSPNGKETKSAKKRRRRKKNSPSQQQRKNPVVVGERVEQTSAVETREADNVKRSGADSGISEEQHLGGAVSEDVGSGEWLTVGSRGKPLGKPLVQEAKQEVSSNCDPKIEETKTATKIEIRTATKIETQATNSRRRKSTQKLPPPVLSMRQQNTADTTAPSVSISTTAPFSLPSLESPVCKSPYTSTFVPLAPVGDAGIEQPYTWAMMEAEWKQREEFVCSPTTNQSSSTQEFVCSPTTNQSSSAQEDSSSSPEPPELSMSPAPSPEPPSPSSEEEEPTRMPGSELCASSDALFAEGGREMSVKRDDEEGSSEPLPLKKSSALHSELHCEIEEFCTFVRATQSQQQQDVLTVAEHICQVVSQIWPTSTVHLTGSRSCGLALADSDIDFAISGVPSMQWDEHAGNCCKTLAAALEQETWVERVVALHRASVPVVKVQCSLTQCSTDITFLPNSAQVDQSPTAHSGLALGQLLCQLGQQHQAMAPLVCILKQLLREQGLNTAYTGGLSSICLSLLVTVHLLHNQPRADLGDALMSFLAWHAQLDYDVSGISLGSGYFGRPRDGSALFVEDPLQPNTGRNIGSSCFAIDAVKTAFKNAHCALQGQGSNGLGYLPAQPVVSTMLSRVLIKRDWELSHGHVFNAQHMQQVNEVCQLWQPSKLPS